MTAVKQAPAYRWDWGLWLRWVGVNALAELIGLGGSALIVIGTLSLVDEDSIGGTFLIAIVSIVLGTFLEGILVGRLQWQVLRHPLPRLPRNEWVRATAIGACVAWVLGMAPSTIISLMSTPSAASPAGSAPPPEEPGAALIYLMAAGMGLVGGVVLAMPQWRTLRRHVRKAGWWIPANSLAWMPGMVLIFAGVTNMPEGPITAGGVLLIVLSILIAGAVVGAIHGVALVWLAGQPAGENRPFA